MNPYLMEKLAGQRAAELRGPAESCHAAAGRAAPRLSVRHRSGRVLMQIGLRLAGARAIPRPGGN